MGVQSPNTQPTDSNLVADVPVSAPQTYVIQLKATIRSAHALLQAGLIGDTTSLLAAFSPEVQPNMDRELTEVRSNLDRTWPNAKRW
jgi:hypothetical protein